MLLLCYEQALYTFVGLDVEAFQDVILPFFLRDSCTKSFSPKRSCNLVSIALRRRLLIFSATDACHDYSLIQ